MVLVNSVGELVDCGRDLQALEEDALLTLNANVLGPLHEASQVALRLDAPTDSEVARVLGEQRTLHFATTLSSRGCSHHLLAFCCLLYLYTRSVTTAPVPQKQMKN